MHCKNENKAGGLEYNLSKWFDSECLRVICIDGGTHGGMCDAKPGAKWVRRKWRISGSTQEFYDLWDIKMRRAKMSNHLYRMDKQGYKDLRLLDTWLMKES